MSSYLTFRKNGTVLCSFSRNTEIYQACRYLAPYDEWGEVTSSDFEVAFSNLEESMKQIQDTREILQEGLKYNLPSEDLFQTLRKIKEADEDLLELESDKAKLSLLRDISNEIYCENDEDGNEIEHDCKFEWMVD